MLLIKINCKIDKKLRTDYFIPLNKIPLNPLKSVTNFELQAS